MYKFTDTISAPLANTPSSEAMSIGGRLLEDYVPHYRTLTVSGRETVDTEITDIAYSVQNGSRFVRKRYLPRKIKVQYMIAAPTNAEFRKAFNSLNAELSGSEQKLIFADEPNFYFIGTLSEMPAPPAGVNTVVGEFTMYCSDPVKYGVSLITQTAEYDISARNATMNIYADTTIEAPCIVTIKPTSTSGMAWILGVTPIPDIKTSDTYANAGTLVIATYTKGQDFVIDGISKKVTSDGVNAFKKMYSLWRFPTLQPGNNQVISSAIGSLSVQYRPCYL